MKIRGAVLEEIGLERPYAKSEPLKILDVELAEPEAEELLVRIEAAGLCHSDLSVIDGNRVRPVPMLIGHESAGIVEKVGANVKDIKVGDRVAMSFLPRCGECKECKTDGRLPCAPGSKANNDGTLLSGRRPHSYADGSGEINLHLGVSAFATHIVTHQSSAVVVPKEVPADIAAVLGCAVLTGGGALLNAAKPEADESLMIIGLGGVGMAALITAVSQQIGRIIAVDALDSKLETAKRLGAHETYTPAELSEKNILADKIIEAAGHPKAFETAYNAIAMGGLLVTVGLPAPKAHSSIAPLNLTAGARTIMGSYLGSAVPARDIPEYARLYLAGKLNVEALISSRIKLDEINHALDELADGKAIRQIIVFDESAVAKTN